MRFSTAWTLAVLLQTAFAAPLAVGNSPPTATHEVSTNAVPHCQSNADYSAQGLEKRGKRPRRSCRRKIKDMIASVQCRCIDVRKDVHVGLNNISAAGKKANHDLVKHVQNGGEELKALGGKVRAKSKAIIS
ncbi:hypothetical protein PspLS_04310 [Pyricularia sp. CBS 133598]|nr:hypothetical protein PspLS_04310 [Pyricularia sp. CBS 133598]